MINRSLLLFTAGAAVMLLAGWVAFPRALYRQVAQPLDFDHKAHTVTAEMECSSCHEYRYDGTFAGIPKIDNCALCHSEPLGETENERKLVDEYITPGKEIPWLVYSRQPINTRFSHSVHTERAKIECERCHGDHGKSATLRPYEYNLVSGYSRDIWGPSISRLRRQPHQGMKMDDCMGCHQERGAVAGCLGCHR